MKLKSKLELAPSISLYETLFSLIKFCKIVIPRWWTLLVLILAHREIEFDTSYHNLSLAIRPMDGSDYPIIDYKLREQFMYLASCC